MPTIDEYSLSAIALKMERNGIIIGRATGFFYRINGRTFLVSNWHVFSGRNTYTGQPSHVQGAVPDKAAFALSVSKSVGSFLDVFSIKLIDEQGNPLWIQHRRGQEIDIAAIEIFTPSDIFMVKTLPLENEAKDMSFKVGMDAFVLGYPNSISQASHLPIWKRASVATEPELSYQDYPLFLIDTATRKGMSGAPVFLRSFGGYDTADNSHVMGPGAFSRFIGIYSGRYGSDDEFGAQLGRVWHRSAIDEVVLERNIGSYEIRYNQ